MGLKGPQKSQNWLIMCRDDQCHPHTLPDQGHRDSRMTEVKFPPSSVKWELRVKVGKLEIIKVRFIHSEFMGKIHIYSNGKMIYYQMNTVCRLNLFQTECPWGKIEVFRVWESLGVKTPSWSPSTQDCVPLTALPYQFLHSHERTSHGALLLDSRGQCWLSLLQTIFSSS